MTFARGQLSHEQTKIEFGGPSPQRNILDCESGGLGRANEKEGRSVTEQQLRGGVSRATLQGLHTGEMNVHV
jgi:hypothetical protein